MTSGSCRRMARPQMTVRRINRVHAAVVASRQRISRFPRLPVPVALFREKFESEVGDGGCRLARAAPTIGRPFRVDGRRFGGPGRNGWQGNEREAYAIRT